MRSLAGRRIVVTRATHQAEELAQPLRSLDATVILLPLIAIAEPADPRPLEAAARSCNSYDWIIFSSANAVEFFAARSQSPFHGRVAAVGEATRDVANAHGFRVSLIPEKYVAESLLDALSKEDLAGKRILIPSAAVTRDVIPETLKKMGAIVDVVEAYRTILPLEAAQAAQHIFREPLPDWITFASSSAVDHAVTLVGTEILNRVAIASIGPITTKTLVRHGLTPRAEANPHTMEGLVTAIAASDMISPQESN